MPDSLTEGIIIMVVSFVIVLTWMAIPSLAFA